MSVRLVLILALIFNLPTRSIDFVLAFPQAELDVPVFMEIPAGMVVEGAEQGEYIIELKKSLYGLRQGSFNWFQEFKAGLETRGFTSSDIDPCIFISKDMILLVYVDDCILVGKSNKAIDGFIDSMNKGDENFDFTDDGDIKNYLGVEFTRHGDGSMELKQEFLMKRIVDAVYFSPNTTKTKDNPVIKPLLTKDEERVERAH